MMKFCFLLVIILHSITLTSQKWVDSQYEIAVETDSIYGTAINYSGKEQPLLLDIAYPLNDEIPECGRPLIMLVHGGAFMAGSKEDYYIKLWLSDFAKKGYVAAAINYRLGMFQTENNITCGVANWGCLNVADSSEWYRGLHRGVQDCRGAIRYMMSKKDTYTIDPNHVFMIGESAGGFITLATTYMEESERSEWTYEINDVSRPAAEYQNLCLPPDAFPIDQMLLNRPDLGPLDGHLHPESSGYKIKGVASIYGGIMSDFLESQEQGSELPALYLFAQPADLIVPFYRNKLMAGLSACATQYSNCASLLNTPNVYGNQGIRALIEEKKAVGIDVPVYKAEFTENYADCILQGLFPQLVGHNIDDYNVRTKSIALFFASYIDEDGDCISSSDSYEKKQNPLIFPNPVLDIFNIEAKGMEMTQLELFDQNGNLFKSYFGRNTQISVRDLSPGVYYLRMHAQGELYLSKIVKL